MNIPTTNNIAGNVGPARKVQPKSTARTCNLNRRSLSAQTETTQIEYSKSSHFDYRRNVVWRLKPDTLISRALNAAKCYFASMGISDGRQEALALLATVLQQEEDWLFTNHDYQLNIQQSEHYTDLIRCRIANEPLE